MTEVKGAPDTLAALKKLAAEVAAWRAFEIELRHAVGNTNFAVLYQRLAEAEAAIAKAESATLHIHERG